MNSVETELQDVSVATEELFSGVFTKSCASRSTLEDIASKWGLLALLALSECPFRFNALRDKVEGVSEKMLSQTLRTLERDGLVNRDVVSTAPARVEYSLTALGSEVAKQLEGVAELLAKSTEVVTAARTAYDARAN